METLLTSLVLILLKSNLCFSQDIYIEGNLCKDDCVKIKHLVSTITNNYRPRIVNIFFHSKLPTFSYQRNDINRDALLDDVLKSLSQSDLKTKANGTKTGPSKAEIISSYKNKKRLVTFDKLAEYSPPSTFNDFDSLINYLNDPTNKREKFVFQIFCIKDKPIVTINSPQSNKTTNLKKVEGVATGTDPISEIQVRINKGGWQKAQGTTNWTVEIPMQNENKYTIDARAIDENHDTSETQTVSDVSYKIISIKVDYVYPDPDKNTAPKRMRNSNHYFAFKFKTNSAIEYDNLSVVIENSEQKELNTVSLNDLSEGTIVENKRDDNTYEYCFSLIYTFLKVEDICKINSKDNYYYYYTTKDKDKIKVPPKILIHFESFNSDPDAYESTNCN